MNKDELKPLIEALVFAADHPLSLDRLCGVLEGEKREDVRDALKELVAGYRSSAGGLYIEEVAGGYQLRTRVEHAPWLRRLFKLGLQRISKAALETLSIIAYKQPITRGELEDVRGVDSAGVLKTLLEKRLIKMVGRKDIPGRPVVYGTTKEFLETFSLKDLSSLPTLKEIETLEQGWGGEEYEIEGTVETEDSKTYSHGRGNLQKEGGGDDTGGQGQGQP